MRFAATRISAVVVAAALVTGCYGSKLVKGPINSEHASVQADSIRAETRELLEKIARLEAELASERDARTRTQAQTTLTLAELEESVRILISRLEDSAQMQSTRSRRPPPAPRVVPPVDTLAADSTRAGGAGGSEEQVYRAAYLDLTRGNFDLAVNGFKNCLARYPSGDYVVEVRYYLGECYYSTEKYVEAVAEFRLVIEDYPDARLVPAAYLKSGRCYQELGENNLAERAYRTLIDQHPSTEEARQARTALDELKG